MATDKDVSDVILVSDFLREWFDVLTEDDFAQDKADMNLTTFVAKEMNIPKHTILELDNICKTSSLTYHGEPTDVESVLKTIPANVKLMTTGIQQMEVDRRNNDAEYKKKARSRMKYMFEDGPWVHFFREKSDETFLPITLPDVLLTVKVYKYFVKGTPVVDQEYQVLGQQRLSELCDVIKCPCDRVIVGEFSANPDSTLLVPAKDLYKSGFFYIEGFFYNDFRSDTNIDYSRYITDWASDPTRGVGPFGSVVMEQTRFLDIQLRLGQPYVYMHQGDCEHLLVFSDMRLVHAGDSHNRADYPLLTARHRDKRVLCRVCAAHNAKWMTQNSQLAPEDPCFFCDTCFRLLHYDQEGNKLCNFEAYHVNSE